MRELTRRQMLAAEVFGYSYDHYEGHLGPAPGTGNVRFERYMPQDIKVLERAESEGWDDVRLARGLEINVGQVPRHRQMYGEAKDIVDAPSLVEAFRRGVRHSIEHAVEDGLESDEDIDDLVTQICYRAADLGYRLKVEGQVLADLSEALRFGPQDAPDAG